MPHSSEITAVYNGTEELIELLVAYFKEGIEKGERCVWVTSDSLPADRAKKELADYGADLNAGLRPAQPEAQLEFLPAKPLQEEAGLVALELSRAVEKEYEKALSNGFTGFRTNINLEKGRHAGEKLAAPLLPLLKNCRKALEELTPEKNLLVLCTLPLEKLSAPELLDLQEESRDIIIKRKGMWGYLGGTEEKMIFLQNLVELIPAPVYYKNEDGAYVGCNQAFEKLMGKKKEEVLGKTICEFGLDALPEEQHLRDIELIKKQENEVYETSLRSSDGKVHRIIVNKVVLKGPSQKDSVLLGIAWDISEQKDLENALLIAKKDAEAANRVKDGFIANMSYELRTPLNSVIGFSDMLLEGNFGTLNTKQSHYVTNIFRSGKHLLEIINNLLDISRLESGEDYLDYEEVDVADLIDEVRLSLIPFASNKKITIKTRPEPALGSILADRAKFKQILYNLLSNAVKFTPKKGLVIVSACSKDGVLEIEVRDNGAGIPKENQEKIFQPFVQKDISSSNEYEGLGLGLYIVKKFVDLHGGAVRVDSEPGKGSTFTVTLPTNTPHKRPMKSRILQT